MQSKSMDWFLYDNGLRHERVKCSEQILLLCTGGDGEHNVSKISVQISLICLFLRLDLDYLIAMRKWPTQIWVNPAERVMCILNYALQHCALEWAKIMRTKCAIKIR